MKCGLLGKSLKHSYSPQIHNMIADYNYDLFQMESEDLPKFFRESDFHGINVTIPYKKAVLPYCNHLSDCAKALGSVNTILRLDDGTFYGHNTDYFGFMYLIKHANVVVSNKKVLVLGSGGASVTVVAVLKELGANVVVISRTGENNYANISNQKDASLIINTTPVGMYPDNGSTPVDLSQFPQLECVVDLIYNPARTKLLLDAEKMGIQAENGLRMLVAQAAESAKLFLKKDIPDDKIEEIHQKLASQMENVILIGMPGCGKSTVGKLLADQLEREFIDADDYLSRYCGVSIPDIIERNGETSFRKMESEVLRELGKGSGLVIATGGGCVTTPCNYEYLHQNGLIIWLQRDLTLLPTDGRPISQKTSINKIYQNRAHLYRDFADKLIENNRCPEETVYKITQEVLK